jgi:hypothetical protein
VSDNRSSEIRNWIALAAAVKDLELDWLSYVPGYRSRALTGVGLCFAYWHCPHSFHRTSLPHSADTQDVHTAVCPQFKNPRIPPMSLSMSQASLPVFEIGLNALSSILDNAEAYEGVGGVSPAFPALRAVTLARNSVSPVDVAPHRPTNGRGRDEASGRLPSCAPSR